MNCCVFAPLPTFYHVQDFSPHENFVLTLRSSVWTELRSTKAASHATDNHHLFYSLDSQYSLVASEQKFSVCLKGTCRIPFPIQFTFFLAMSWTSRTRIFISAIIPPSHTYTTYLYNGCLPWYNVVITSRATQTWNTVNSQSCTFILVF